MTERTTRRRLLQTGAVASGLALAGCLGGDDENGEEENGEENGEEAETEQAFASASPVCHDYADDRHAYVTLGPGYDGGGLFVFDVEEFEIVEEFPEIPANCGTIAHPEEPKFYVNAGRADVDGAEPAGEWWVFDTEEHLPIDPETGEAVEDYDLEDVTRDGRGNDTHGVWFTPDNEELWMVNRDTDNGFVVDPETDEVIDEIEYAGESPDILTASPDGQYVFATTRGPEQQSGPHTIAGEEPGVAVLDVESRELVEVIEPDPLDNYTEEEIEGDAPTPDFHGIGLVPGESDDDYELWAVDQGTATLYTIEPAGDGFDVTDEVDLGDGNEETPHMVDFDSEFRFGVVPSTSGGKTQFVRVDDHEYLEELDLDTGASSHFAGVNPGDETILVDVIGAEKLVEIEADFDAGEFEIGQELVLSDLEQFPADE